jgi:hypothetical protein
MLARRAEGVGEEILMTAGQLYRLSGLLLLAGAILSIVSSVGSGILFPDPSSPSAATNPVNVSLSVIGVIGTILALLGLPGAYLVRAAVGGVMWLLGVLLIAVTGMLFGIFAALTFAILFPAIGAQAPNLLSQGPPAAFLGVFIIATIANVVGAALMGVAMLRRQMFPRWCGWLMILEAVLAAVSFVANGPSSSGLLSQILNAVSALPLFIVLAWIGYALWSRKLGTAEYFQGAVSPQPA